MSVNRKLIFLAAILGITVFAGLIIFSACDNRKTISAAINEVATITMSVNPANVIVNSLLEPDTATIHIWVTNEDGEGLDSVEVTLLHEPQVGAIIAPDITEDGYTTALFITIPGSTFDDSLVVFTANAGNVSQTETLVIVNNIQTTQWISMDFDPPELIIQSSANPDTVTIGIWVRDEEGGGINNAEVVLTRNPEIGTIIQPVVTADGYTEAAFITDLGIEENISVVFTATTSIATHSDTLSIIRPTQELFMHFDPPVLVIYSADTPEIVTINIWARDENGTGADGVEVTLSRTPSIGTLIQPEPTEDGYTQGFFMADPGIEYDTSIVFTAQTANAAYIDTLDILYSSHMVSMSFNPPQLVIYSPNKADTAEINIWVRNEDGSGVDSVEVYVSRTPEVGTIVPPPITINGYTQALYITDPGNYADTTLIFTAQTGSAWDVDTLNVILRLQGEIANMTVSLQKSRLTADGEDQTNIYVFATDTTGGPIGDNTLLCIENYGASSPGLLSPPCTTIVNGTATFTLTAPNILDTLLITETDSLQAWGVSISGDTTFAYATVIYEPDVPAELEIITYPEPMIAGSGEFDSIWVRVTDNFGSYVINGTQVQFKNVLLSSDITGLTTTLGGYAVGIYTVGTEAGLDIINAFIVNPGSTDTLWSNAVPLEVRSSAPTNVELTTSNQTIEVGGIATMVYATMQDENENPLSDGYGVRFEITAHPSMGILGQSPSFQHVPFDSLTLTVEAVTDVNGRASVALFSGTVAGTVRIKATSTDNENIFKEKPLVTIQSGPPAFISISPSNIAQPEGEALITGITANVSDTFSNPVEPGTAVYFAVIPPEYALIEGAAYTGGWIDTVTGDTIGHRGLAFTWMAYSCHNTFDTVNVIASSGSMADTSGIIILALYDGQIDIWPVPGYIYVPEAGDTLYADISAQLLDGLGCRIHYGVINFTVAVCGMITGAYCDTTDDEGMVYTEFGIAFEQIPSQPPPPQCTAKVNAKLQGYPDVEGECEIYCSKP